MALRDGEPYLAWGSPGGDQQDQWNTQFFLRHVHAGMNLQEAIDAPAWHSEHFPISFWPRTARPGVLVRRKSRAEGNGRRADAPRPYRRGRPGLVGRPPDRRLAHRQTAARRRQSARHARLRGRTIARMTWSIIARDPATGDLADRGRDEILRGRLTRAAYRGRRRRGGDASARQSVLWRPRAEASARGTVAGRRSSRGSRPATQGATIASFTSWMRAGRIAAAHGQRLRRLVRTPEGRRLLDRRQHARRSAGDRGHGRDVC